MLLAVILAMLALAFNPWFGVSAVMLGVAGLMLNVGIRA